MKKVIIYTGMRCAHCDWAKALLKQKKVDFTEYNISEIPEKKEEMLNKSNGRKTIPQIFFNEFHVGGYEELRSLEKKGELLNLIK